jgi:hypothetical protein
MWGGGVLLLLIVISTIISCKKNIGSVASPKEAEILTQNKELIAALIKGEVIQDTGFATSTANNPTSTSSSDYSVTLVNGMLKFNSSDGMLNFLGALDYTISNWNTDADPELQGLASEKTISGNATKNAFDSAIGFQSLRKKYEMAYYDNPNYKTTLPFLINEEDTRTVLNINHEVQIGTTIYRFMASNVVAEILNEDYATLNFLRTHPGMSIDNPNLKLKNATTGEELPKTTPTGTLGACEITLSYNITENYQGDYRQVSVVLIPGAQKDGTASFCGFIGTINWGDGFSESNLVASHIYNVSPSPGQCSAFNITMKVQAITCSIADCDGRFSPTASKSISICNAVTGCGQNTDYKESDPTYFNYGGIDYRIIGGIGSQHSTSLWPRRNMIYSRTFWQKSRDGRWYPTSNKKVHLTVRVYGPIWLNKCSTLSQRDRSTTKRNQVHVEVNDDAINNPFGYTRVEPNVLKSDHTIFIDIGSGYTNSIIGHKLK